MVSVNISTGRLSSSKGRTDSKAETKTEGCFPARYILTALTFFGMCLIFAQRVCLNVAMVAMVNNTMEETSAIAKSEERENSTGEEIGSGQCNGQQQNYNTSFHYMQGTYPWTPSIQGVILGSYFYGYVFAQIIGGRLTDFCGAKRLFGCATLLSSLLSIATPFVADVQNSAKYVITLRVILGLVHGMNYPSAYTLFARWAPLQERSTMLSVCVIGTHFGVVISMSLTGYLCEYGFAGGWPSSFYVLGLAGVVWYAFWFFLVYDSPSEHPRVDPRERDFILQNLPTLTEDKKRPTPWLRALRSIPLWAVTVAKFTGAWSFICFQTKLPAYLNDVLHFPIQKNGLVNALLFGTLCFSIVSAGFASDLIRTKTSWRITTIRKSFEAVALLGPAACMASIPAMGCDGTAVVGLLTGAMALFGFCGGGDVSVIVDLVPDFAGKIFGVSNAIASIPGILAPTVSGIFLEGGKGDSQRWAYIFYISVALYLCGAFVFLVFGSAETESWGIADNCTKPGDHEEGKKKKGATSSSKLPDESLKPKVRRERTFSIVSAGEVSLF